MKRIYRIGWPLFLVISIGLTGCGDKEVKPVPPEITIADTAIKAVFAIKDAFSDGDLIRVKDIISNDIYKKISSNRKNLSKVFLEFKNYWIEIVPGKTTVFVEWTARWRARGGEIFEATGIGGFVMKGNPPTLIDILRDNPFDLK